MCDNVQAYLVKDSNMIEKICPERDQIHGLLRLKSIGVVRWLNP